MSHVAKATNWDGKTVEVTFKLNADDLERLCKRAHNAFHSEGKYTIQLKSIYGISVPVELQYRR